MVHPLLATEPLPYNGLKMLMPHELEIGRSGNGGSPRSRGAGRNTRALSEAAALCANVSVSLTTLPIAQKSRLKFLFPSSNMLQASILPLKSSRKSGGKSPRLCQTDAILVTCRQPFSEEIIFPALGVAKVGVSLRWREGGIDLESAGSTRPTAVYGAFIERNRLV